MTSVEFSRDEVERLVKKLVGLDLSPDERELLLAIFWAASDQVSQVKPRAASEPSELSKQLTESFLSDTGKKFLLQVELKHGPHRHRGEST